MLSHFEILSKFRSIRYFKVYCLRLTFYILSFLSMISFDLFILYNKIEHILVYRLLVVLYFEGRNGYDDKIFSIRYELLQIINSILESYRLLFVYFTEMAPHGVRVNSVK